MAREYGRVWISIWSDPEFTALDTNTQWLYLALLSQPGMTTCGAQPFTPNRWASLSPALTGKRTELAMGHLERVRLVVADRHTDELVIRSHLRYDKPLRNVNTAKAFARTWKDVRSAAIRKVILIELQRLHDEGEFEEWIGWTLPEIKTLVATEIGAVV